MSENTKKPKTPPPPVKKIGLLLEEEGLAYRPTKPTASGTPPSKVKENYDELSAQNIVTAEDPNIKKLKENRYSSPPTHSTKSRKHPKKGNRSSCQQIKKSKTDKRR